MEETIIKILKSIGLNDIVSCYIVAVHCLNHKSIIVNTKVQLVVRFVNRKDAFRSLECKKNLAICGEKLGIYKLFMVESLFPVYRNLMDKCLHLKRTGALLNVPYCNIQKHFS